MAVYRQIHVSFWQDPFILELTPEEKYFYLYLMTNSKTKQCGVYELPKKVIELETGYNQDTIKKLINKFIEYGKIDYNESSKEIMLKNWLKYNSSKSPKVMKCIEKEVEEIKNVTFKKYCIDTLSIEYPNCIDSLDIDLGEEKEQEQEDNKKKIQYGDFVEMTEKDYLKLIEKYGEENTKLMIEKLDNHIGAKGKDPYKDHYRAILKWVVNAVMNDINKTPPAVKPTKREMTDDELSMEELYQKRKKKIIDMQEVGAC